MAGQPDEEEKTEQSQRLTRKQRGTRRCLLRKLILYKMKRRKDGGRKRQRGARIGGGNKG